MYPGNLSVGWGISAEGRAVLQAKEHPLRVRPEWSTGSNAAIVDREHGVLAAGVDPDRGDRLREVRKPEYGKG